VGRLDVSALNNAFVAITVILGLTIILIPLRLRALDRRDLILAETTELQFSKQQSAFHSKVKEMHPDHYFWFMRYPTKLEGQKTF
jgi:hypothetical protein